MHTEILTLNSSSVRLGAELINRGELVAFPTETVYGLGANALNEAAVKKIYIAKGRPSDNPLIVHLSSFADAQALVTQIPETAKMLAEKFMPGPLTIVLPKKPCVPDCVTGGINTVAIRVPEHAGARLFIAACGCPIAAPSANSSGKPSPTCAAHVSEDLNGKIPLILDGGVCNGGVESTVISLVGETPELLRPGLITVEALRSVLGKVTIHPSVLNAGKVDKAASPGMKYKHYSPRARVITVNGKPEDVCALFDAALALGKKPLILWEKEQLPLLGDRCKKEYFDLGNAEQAAHNLFALLRESDSLGFDTVFIKALPTDGAGLSVMNRLLRASAFTVLTAEDAKNSERAIKNCFSNSDKMTTI